MPVPGYVSWLEIMAIVDSSHKKLLKGLKCGERAWKTLEELYDTAGGSSTVSQLRELFQAKLTGSVFEFTTLLKAKFDRLELNYINFDEAVKKVILIWPFVMSRKRVK